MYIEISHIPPTVEALIAALGVLGGLMAFWSGLLVTAAYLTARPSSALADAISHGLVVGFLTGMILAVKVAMIVIGNA
jgi:hypothetical protein